MSCGVVRDFRLEKVSVPDPQSLPSEAGLDQIDVSGDNKVTKRIKKSGLLTSRQPREGSRTFLHFVSMTAGENGKMVASSRRSLDAGYVYVIGDRNNPAYTHGFDLALRTMRVGEQVRRDRLVLM